MKLAIPCRCGRPYCYIQYPIDSNKAFDRFVVHNKIGRWLEGRVRVWRVKNRVSKYKWELMERSMHPDKYGNF